MHCRMGWVQWFPTGWKICQLGVANSAHFRNTSPTWKNYSQLEKEALVIVFAVKEHFTPTCMSILTTSHWVISWVSQIGYPTTVPSQIQQWALTLSRYNSYEYITAYHPDKDQGYAQSSTTSSDSTQSQSLVTKYSIRPTQALQRQRVWKEVWWPNISADLEDKSNSLWWLSIKSTPTSIGTSTPMRMAVKAMLPISVSYQLSARIYYRHQMHLLSAPIWTHNKRKVYRIRPHATQGVFAFCSRLWNYPSLTLPLTSKH